MQASGGIAQYELNQLMQEARRQGCAMPTIQAFMATVHCSKESPWRRPLEKLMPAHVLCLRLLYTIQVIILSGDEACRPGGGSRADGSPGS